MLAPLLLLVTLAQTPFVSNTERAVESARSQKWKDAAISLERAWAEDPEAFTANNLHYLWGRAAEASQDWARAAEEFGRIDFKSTLRPLAVWHGARAAMNLGALEQAAQWIDELPQDFPEILRLQLAKEAPPALALRLVNTSSSRGARFQRAQILRDGDALWVLLRENNTDDVALSVVRLLAPVASTAREWRDVGGAFLAQRQFGAASTAYEQLGTTVEFLPEAHYQLARVRFFAGDYETAARDYEKLVSDFPDSEWSEQAAYQSGVSYWRARKYKEAELALTAYLERFKNKGSRDNAIQDLVDIYRSQGQGNKAIALIDRSLRARTTAANRQVLLFTKVKILYGQGNFTAALRLIQEIKRTKLQNAAGGTTTEELLYLEALCLMKTGDSSTSKTVLRRLAANPRSYYGQLSAEHLSSRGAEARPTSVSADAECTQTGDTPALAASRLLARRHPVRTEEPASVDVVTELLFLGLWDEASLWLDRTRRPDPSLAADLAYVSGRYERAILFADRLPDAVDGVEQMRFPRAFRDSICSAASKYGADPSWLHAIIWQESKYDPAAQSAAAARGLMQFIPDTAEVVAGRIGLGNLTLERLYDPTVSITLGAAYWASLMEEFGTPELALAAYNGGPDNVRRWQDKGQGKATDLFVSEIGFTETKKYVQAVFAAHAAYAKPK